MRSAAQIVSIATLLFASLLVLPLSARAQMRAASIGKARPPFHSFHVRPVASDAVATARARIMTPAPASAPAPASVQSLNAGSRFGSTLAGASGQTLQQLLDPVPGLGFDYAHLAAIDSDLAIKAVIDPETQWRLAVAEHVVRDAGEFSTPGYYLLDGGAAYVVPTQSMPAPPQEQKPPQSQPTIIVLKEPPATQPSLTQAAPAVAPQPSAPLPNVSSFTLVLHGGKKIHAIAFTRVSDRIVYITADGVRHSFAASQLNAAATRRINEENGTPLQL